LQVNSEQQNDNEMSPRGAQNLCSCVEFHYPRQGYCHHASLFVGWFVRYARCDCSKSIIKPPVYGSNGRTYKMLVMFFFRHAFSELPRPIALKLCNLIGICVYLIMQVQKLGGHSPKKIGGQKHAKFRSILDHFRL